MKSMTELADQFIEEEYHFKNKAPATLRSGKGILNGLLDIAMKNKYFTWKEFTTTDINRYLEQHCHQPSSRSLRVVTLKKIFNWLHTNQHIEVNILQKYTSKAVQPPLICPSPQQFQAMQKKIQKSRGMSFKDKMIFFLICDTGLRASEIGDIELKYINFEENMIHIPQTKTNIPKIACFGERTRQYLLWYIKKKPNRKYLFIHRNTSHSAYRQVWIASNKAFKIWDPLWAGKRGAHTLRHAFCTDWIAKTRDLFGLKFTIGWKKIATADRYVHANPVLMKEMWDSYDRKRKEK